jgi:hypothetical protein
MEPMGHSYIAFRVMVETCMTRNAKAPSPARIEKNRTGKDDVSGRSGRARSLRKGAGGKMPETGYVGVYLVGSTRYGVRDVFFCTVPMAALSAWIPYTNPMFRVASNGRVSTHAA